jgi:glycosyltransferase involved in cell wall biosynthesis
MKKLSVALAVFNEEKNIERCIRSVKDFADEIIIVDGTSTDKTVELAKKYTSYITITSNPSNFHINKQKALDLCTGEWILQLDADEVVTSSLSKEIQKVMQENDNNGYWIPRKNFFLGRFLMKGGQYPDYTLRLYRNGKAYLPQKDVHEQAVIIGKVGYLHEALLHYPYENFSFYLANVAAPKSAFKS